MNQNQNQNTEPQTADAVDFTAVEKRLQQINTAQTTADDLGQTMLSLLSLLPVLMQKYRSLSDADQTLTRRCSDLSGRLEPYCGTRNGKRRLYDLKSDRPRDRRRLDQTVCHSVDSDAVVELQQIRAEQQRLSVDSMLMEQYLTAWSEQRQTLLSRITQKQIKTRNRQQQRLLSALIATEPHEKWQGRKQTADSVCGVSGAVLTEYLKNGKRFSLSALLSAAGICRQTLDTERSSKGRVNLENGQRLWSGYAFPYPQHQQCLSDRLFLSASVRLCGAVSAEQQTDHSVSCRQLLTLLSDWEQLTADNSVRDRFKRNPYYDRTGTVRNLLRFKVWKRSQHSSLIPAPDRIRVYRRQRQLLSDCVCGVSGQQIILTGLSDAGYITFQGQQIPVYKRLVYCFGQTQTSAEYLLGKPQTAESALALRQLRYAVSQTQTLHTECSVFDWTEPADRQQTLPYADADAQQTLTERLTAVVGSWSFRSWCNSDGLTAAEKRQRNRQMTAGYLRKLRQLPSVSLSDSYAVGNCRPGTERFCQQIGLSAAVSSLSGAVLARYWQKSGYPGNSLFFLVIDRMTEQQTQTAESDAVSAESMVTA